MKSTKVYLDPVTFTNWNACIALKLSPDQEKFLPGNLYSIAESQFYEDSRSRAIYNEEDLLVGYALFGRDSFTNKWKIFRIMIDQSFQGKGYGESAMKEIIKQISQETDGNEILICYQDANETARRLYAKLGFVEQEIDVEGKVTALLRVCNDVS
ncbi:MAG TPA: GNAT family N-acetyltransferase [Anaerolineales bacterium]|nr:GNAT family N-acetyltransferase [Anaerolineales bacterium]